MSLNRILTFFILFVSFNSFSLSLGKIQRNNFGEAIGVLRVEGEAICNQQGLRLPSSQQLRTILADRRNMEELKEGVFWSSDKGVLLFGVWAYIADGWDWYDSTAGVICLK